MSTLLNQNFSSNDLTILYFQIADDPTYRTLLAKLQSLLPQLNVKGVPELENLILDALRQKREPVPYETLASPDHQRPFIEELKSKLGSEGPKRLENLLVADRTLTEEEREQKMEDLKMMNFILMDYVSTEARKLKVKMVKMAIQQTSLPDLISDRVTSDRVTDDRVTDDRVTDDRVTDDLITDDLITDDLITDDLITDDLITDDLITDEPTTTFIVSQPKVSEEELEKVSTQMDRQVTLDLINLTNKLNLNGYELPHSRQFSNFTKSVLSEVPQTFEEDESQVHHLLKMRQHQEVIRRYMSSIPLFKHNLNINDPNYLALKETRTPLTPYRGCLFYHDMGTGKTLTGIHLAISFIQDYRLPLLAELINSGRRDLIGNFSAERRGKVIFMFFKRLQRTWETSLYRYLDEHYDIESYFKDYYQPDGSTESGVIMETIKMVIEEDSELDFQGAKELIAETDLFEGIKHQVVQLFIRDHVLFQTANTSPRLVDDLRQNPLRHNLVVIDEIHNIISYIHSSVMELPGRPPGKTGVHVYEWLMNSFDSKIVGLSGTPIINYASELLILANILRGKMSEGTKIGEYEPLFSLDKEKIDQLIYDDDDDILNPEMVSRRLTGLVSRKMRDPSPEYPVSFWAETLPWSGEEVPWFAERQKLYDEESQKIIPLSIGEVRVINVEFSESQFLAYTKLSERPSQYTFNKSKHSAYAGTSFTESLGICSYPLNRSALYQIKIVGEGEKTRFLKRTLESDQKQLKQNILDLSMSSYSLFRGMATTSKIQKDLLFIDSNDVNQFINRLFSDIKDRHPNLFFQVQMDLTQSKNEPSRLYSQSIFKAIEIYRDQVTEREFESDKFEYYYENAENDSPKIARVLKTIVDPTNKDLHFVYSRTIVYGAFHLEGYLQSYRSDDAPYGYEPYVFREIFQNKITDPNLIKMVVKKEIERLKGLVNEGRRFYIKYTENYQFIRNGEKVSGPPLTIEEMTDTINYIFNSHENRFGDIIKVLIGTTKSKEGLDLRHVRQVYIMDPWWNMVGPEQAMGRAIRYLSHSRVVQEPNEEPRIEGFENVADRYVKIDLLVGVMSEKQKIRYQNMVSQSVNTTTTDEFAFKKAIDKLRTSQKLEEILNKSAIDCGLYDKEKAALEPSPELATVECINRYAPDETGLSYEKSVLNDPSDIEFYESRRPTDVQYRQIHFDGETLYRRENDSSSVKIRYKIGAVQTKKAQLILYRPVSQKLVPAYGIVKDDAGAILKIKYPLFQIVEVEDEHDQ